MPPSIVAFGHFEPHKDVVVSAAEAVGGAIRFATTMAELDIAHMPGRPAAMLLRLDAEHLDDIVEALHTHPKLEGVPLLAILPRLTEQAAIRAVCLGADDFLSLEDMPRLLARKLGAATRATASRPKPKQCRVLLVDPSPLHSRVLSRLLTQAGFEVRPLATVEEALAELTTPKGYGLVIVDLGIEAFDPPAFLSSMREKLGEAAPPAIAMTHSMVRPEITRAASAAGFRHIHDKRRAPDELVFLAHEASVTDHSRLRASPRMLCSVLVGFRREGSRWEYGLSHNISLSGLFVRTIDPPEPGPLLELEFTPPSSERPIAPRAEVVWRKEFSEREVRASPTGMGLRLVEADDTVQRAMARAVADLAHTGPRRA